MYIVSLHMEEGENGKCGGRDGGSKQRDKPNAKSSQTSVCLARVIAVPVEVGDLEAQVEGTCSHFYADVYMLLVYLHPPLRHSITI
jgi:hypothetical protein